MRHDLDVKRKALAVTATTILLLSALPVLALAATVGSGDQPFASQAYRRLLGRHVSPGTIDGISSTLVDYGSLRADPDYSRALDDFTGADPARMSRTERFAFWINAYNLMAIKTVVDRYPMSSIKDGGNLLFPIWKKKVATVAGKERNLDEVEHAILRPEFGDPRVHFAIVCASLSCPDLRNEPYGPDRLDAQLDDAARAFLANGSKGLAMPETGDVVRVSRIFKWFGDDFAAGGGVPAFLLANAPAAFASRLKNLAPGELSYLNYDWSLNDRARAK